MRRQVEDSHLYCRPVVILIMRCDLFTDPRYHAETHIELDPTQVFSTAEKTVKLFMGGAHRVTEVTLQSGEVLLVKGEIARRIEAARIEAARRKT